MTVVSFREWEFLADVELTKQTYQQVINSGAESCNCNDCQNYIAYRDKVFPPDIQKLFEDLGLDYNKEVEITSWQTLPNGYHHIGGWFHFKGEIVKGESCQISLLTGGHNLQLTRVHKNFSIGFFEGNSLTFFKDKDGLIQIEFETGIPWVIDKSLETK